MYLKPTPTTIHLDFQSRFTIALPGELSFHKCPILTVRGTNRVGMVSLLTADVVDCEAEGPALVVPLVVLDAVGQTAQGQYTTGASNQSQAELCRQVATETKVKVIVKVK